MPEYNGRQYFDDRLFVLQVVPATKAGASVWAVVTRHNRPGYHPWRVDDFPTLESAHEYVRAVEPGTPRIGLDGQPPNSPISYPEYCAQLAVESLKPSVEMLIEQRQMPYQVDITTIPDQSSKEDGLE